MAETKFDVGSAEEKQLLEEEFFRDMNYENYFQKFEGNGADSIVQVKTQLEKVDGDKITFFLIKKLNGDGITGTSGVSLEGNEEALETENFALYLEEYSNATRDRGPLDRKRVFFSIDEEARTALKNWGANKQEKLAFDSIFASRTKMFYGGAATALTNLTTSDKLTPAKISFMKTGASTGWNRAQIPLRGVKVGGKLYYILLIHPDALYDLRQNPEMQQALREAEVRGSENPIFSGAEFIYDGVVIHSHELCPIGTDAGAASNVPYAKGVLLGAQAMCKAWGKRPEIVAEEFDYGRKHGFALIMLMKYEKAVFNGADFAVSGLDVARTKVSDE